MSFDDYFNEATEMPEDSSEYSSDGDFWDDDYTWTMDALHHHDDGNDAGMGHLAEHEIAEHDTAEHEIVEHEYDENRDAAEHELAEHQYDENRDEIKITPEVQHAVDAYLKEVEHQALSDLVPLLPVKKDHDHDGEERDSETLVREELEAVTHDEIKQIEQASSSEHVTADTEEILVEQPFDEQEFMNYVIKLVI